MSAKNPKISIVTINFNNGPGLEDTIKSVINQSYGFIEYLVIDGASVDSSLKLIETYSDRIFFWVSEPDNGIYHAMNKGIEQATGEYILFLNSGDRLINDTVIAEVANIGLTHDLVYGDLLFFDHEKTWSWNLPDQITFKSFYQSTIPHPSTFIKRSLFDKAGPYDEKLKVVSDWKFFITALAIHNASYLHINKVISAYNFDGISSKPENLKLIDFERLQVLNEYFPFFVDDYKTLTAVELEMKKIKYFLKTRKLIKKIINQK
jgi:glycosyltransferase involved in cell wall biosynthesis